MKLHMNFPKREIKVTRAGEFWFLNGRLHREDGPAILTSTLKCWCQNGKFHRVNGPAIVKTSKIDYSQIKTVELTSRKTIIRGLQSLSQEPKNLEESHMSQSRLGKMSSLSDKRDKSIYRHEEYFFNGIRHREDGPAVIGLDGIKMWYFNGKLHRKDKPAIIYPDGSKEWYFNGLRHRIDGPAQIKADGTLIWWQYGKMYRENGPNIIFISGLMYWKSNGIVIRRLPNGKFYYLKPELGWKLLRKIPQKILQSCN